MWNDPDIAINWCLPADMEVLLSEKDKKNPQLKNLGFSFE